MSDEHVVLGWAVRDSLLSYMTAEKSFEVELSGDAAFDPVEGVRIAARGLPGGAIVCTGSVVLRAHDGAMAVPLVDARIEGQALWIRDPEEPSRLMTLVTLSDPVVSGSRTTWETSLAPEADLLFRFMYAPGVPFAPLVVEGQGSG